MARVNITVPDGLLEEIDRTAAGQGATRSGFLQEASARYIADVRAAEEAEQRARDIDEAAALARRIGRKVNAGYDATDRIRRDRKRDSR